MDSQVLLLTPDEAAKRLGVARSFLYRRLLAPVGPLRSVKIGGRARRIHVRDLENYAESLRESGGDAA